MRMRIRFSPVAPHMDPQMGFHKGIMIPTRMTTLVIFVPIITCNYIF